MNMTGHSNEIKKKSSRSLSPGAMLSFRYRRNQIVIMEFIFQATGTTIACMINYFLLDGHIHPYQHKDSMCLNEIVSSYFIDLLFFSSLKFQLLPKKLVIKRQHQSIVFKIERQNLVFKAQHLKVDIEQ